MSEVGEVFVRVRADSTGFKQEAAGPIASAGRDLSKVFLAAFAVGGIAKSVESVVKAATEHQSAFAVLGQTTKNAGAANDVAGQSIEDLLEKEARLKGFTDEDLASAFQRLVAVTHDSKSALSDLGEAEDLSRFRHIDLAAAALAESKALQGSTSALQRYGIVVPQVTTAEDELTLAHQQAVAAGAKFTEAQKEQYDAALQAAKAQDAQARTTEALSLIQQRAGGAAQVFAQTTAGQFDRLQQDFHQFEVAVGTGLLSSLAGAAEGLGRFFTEAANSQRVRADIDALTGDIRSGFADVKDVAETVAPVLLTVAGAAKEVVSAIGGPAILTAVVAYKALGIAQKEIAGAEGLVARARAASLGQTLADSSAQGKYTAALVANTEALNVNAVAAGRAAAANEAVGVSAEAASAGEAAAAATEATGGLVSGFGALALGAAGGPVGLAVIGVAALAGGIAYLATRESATTAATHALESAVQGLAQAEGQLPSDRLAVAEDKLALKRDQNALATSKLSHTSLEYQQLLLNLTGDTLTLDAAEETLRNGLAATDAAFDKTKQKVTDLAKEVAAAARPTGELPGRGGVGRTPGGINQPRIDQSAATAYAHSIQAVLDSGQKLTGVQQHNLQLLEQFTEVLGRVPTQKQIDLILDNKSATLTLQNFERELEGLPPLAAAAAAKAGEAVTDNFNAAVLAGASQFQLGPSISREFSLLPSLAGPSAADAGTSLGGIFGGALLSASAGEIEAAANAAAAIQNEAEAQAKFEAATKPLREGITSDKQDLSQLATDMADAVTQGAQQLAAAVQQAKGNLNTIGQDLAQSLQQFIEKPLNDEQAKISAAQNRLSLLGDKTTLQNLRGEVLLPGGKTLSQDPTKAIAQLQALEKTSKSPALQTFIQQYQAAALQERSDSLATKQAVAQAIEQRASTRLANLTDLFNQGKISQQTLERDVTAVLRKQGLTEKTAKSRGAAFADTVAGQLTGLDQQATAIGQVPQSGSGLVPSIVRPIDTLNATQKSIAGIAKQQRDKQLDESKKQTALLQKIHGNQAAEKATGSLDHNPGTKTKRAVDLVGTGG